MLGGSITVIVHHTIKETIALSYVNVSLPRVRNSARIHSRKDSPEQGYENPSRF